MFRPKGTTIVGLVVALLRLLPRPMLHAVVGRAPNVRRGESRGQVQ